jgi:hypothetical protein
VETRRGWEQVVWEGKGVEKERLGKTMTYPYYFFSILPPFNMILSCFKSAFIFSLALSSPKRVLPFRLRTFTLSIIIIIII